MSSHEYVSQLSWGVTQHTPETPKYPLLLKIKKFFDIQK